MIKEKSGTENWIINSMDYSKYIGYYKNFMALPITQCLMFFSVMEPALPFLYFPLHFYYLTAGI